MTVEGRVLLFYIFIEYIFILNAFFSVKSKRQLFMNHGETDCDFRLNPNFLPIYLKDL